MKTIANIFVVTWCKPRCIVFSSVHHVTNRCWSSWRQLLLVWDPCSPFTHLRQRWSQPSSRYHFCRIKSPVMIQMPQWALKGWLRHWVVVTYQSFLLVSQVWHTSASSLPSLFFFKWPRELLITNMYCWHQSALWMLKPIHGQFFSHQSCFLHSYQISWREYFFNKVFLLKMRKGGSLYPSAVVSSFIVHWCFLLLQLLLALSFNLPYLF